MSSWGSQWNRWDDDRSWRSRDWHQDNYSQRQDSTFEVKSSIRDNELPSSFRPDEYHLDISRNPPLHRTVQATAWSRKQGIAGLPVEQVTVASLARNGLEEWSLRPLSAGRYTGMVLTRSIAEGVLCSRILHHLRNKQWDIDMMAEQIFRDTHPDLPIPNKHSEAKDFIDPMSLKVIEVLDKYAQVKPSSSNTSSQVGALQEKLRRYEQKANEHGIQLTPTKTGPQNIANDQNEARIRADKRLPLFDAHAPPEKKTKIMECSLDSLMQPKTPQTQTSNIKDVKQWCSEFRQEMTAETSKQFDKFAEKASKILTNVKKPELQAAAVKWGLPFQLSTSPPKTLTQFITVSAFKAG